VYLGNIMTNKTSNNVLPIFFAALFYSFCGLWITSKATECIVGKLMKNV